MIPKLTPPHGSYIIVIPVGKTNYLGITDLLTKIFGPPLKSGWYISNSRDNPRHWVVCVKGNPDKKFTRLSLELSCTLIERENDLYCR